MARPTDELAVGGALERDIEAEEPLPPGAPRDFRRRLALALKTAEPDVLRAAEGAYRGVYPSEHAYIVSRVAEHLREPDMMWMLDCCEPNLLRDGYEGGVRVVWSIALELGACMVFESPRAPTGVAGDEGEAHGLIDDADEGV